MSASHIARLVAGLCVLGCSQSPPPVSVERAWPVMGTLLRIEVTGPDSVTAVAAAQDAFDSVSAVDSALSAYRDDSELLTLLREPAGAPLPASNILIENLALAREADEITGGAFDITLSGNMADIVADSAAHTIALRSEGLTIDFGGSAKGDALDRALRAIPLDYDAMVDLGGQVSVRSAVGTLRQIAIVDPTDPTRSLAVVEIINGSVATSATYERGQHIIDPRSGVPPGGSDALISATVVHDSGGWADAFSTAFFVLGAGRSVQIADSLGIGFLGVRKMEGGLTAEEIVMSERMREIVSLREDLVD